MRALLLLLAAPLAGCVTRLQTEFFLVPETPRLNRSGDAPSASLLREEPWAVPLVALAGLTMAAIAAFEVFVLCKARAAAPSRRHLLLGQALLLGLFLCAGAGGTAAASPSPLSCGALRFGAGTSLALVLAALLVKCVFLMSLNGGVYLPAPYQALLLLFAALVQVAVGLQWLLHAPPRLRVPSTSGVVTAAELRTPACRAPLTELLGSLAYPLALLLLVGVLAAKSRAIRDNYREATFIALAAGGAALLSAAWVGAALLLPAHPDACLGFGLASTSALVFLVMFMPKGRQLAAMGRQGVYVEDSLTPPGSHYSPSFFHFKPAALPPKHPLPPVTDRVALVAPPPTYPRMYHHHYYPYCLYPGGVYMKAEDGNVYTTLEPTLSSNPNVYFQRSGVHPGMMY